MLKIIYFLILFSSKINKIKVIKGNDERYTIYNNYNQTNKNTLYKIQENFIIYDAIKNKNFNKIINKYDDLLLNLENGNLFNDWNFKF
jgi:hypothetical protein